ncbi:NAD(P)-dependent oxidoreductase [Agrococcus sp. SGAir0287]|uniref:NAD(P)-dependent oxidoreductase n=1 Tax=Agrococcus sp. SGAir0287 TaxID=2070347 RepID=UPI0010CD24E3|nr:NAD(P)-dependent oxidoreductase [Agrococcus sp. SGAir0287]QCR18782.1 phosphoglycerate dehydrogenase [Agrococcus sp. SGAir0287]
MKVLVPSTVSLDLPGHEVVAFDPDRPIPDEHRDADALVEWVLPAERLAEATALPRLRLVQTLSAGPDVIAAAGFDDGVALASGRSLHDATVAEHTLAMLLALVRDLPRLASAQDEGRWDDAYRADQADPQTGGRFTLDGAHVAIWGFGGIAQRLAPMLEALGARVTGIARSTGDRGGYPVVAHDLLPELLPRVDVLVSILPATAATDRVVDAGVLAALPDHALFVNVGRGAVVDEDDLRAALEQGTLRAAAIDVTRVEPLPAGDPLWTTPHLLITPHVAGGRPRGAAALVLENLAAIEAGEPVRNRV